MSALKRHSSPGLVISILALAVAVGTSGAIALPGRGSVDGNDLGQNSVASKNIKANTIKPGDVNEGQFYVGVEVNDAGAVTESTIPGVSANGFTGDQTRVTFPRNVTSCTPVASAVFSGNVLALQAGTAPDNRNDVIVYNDGAAKSFNLIIVC
jgi:hypothetical protein